MKPFSMIAIALAMCLPAAVAFGQNAPAAGTEPSASPAPAASPAAEPAAPAPATPAPEAKPSPAPSQATSAPSSAPSESETKSNEAKSNEAKSDDAKSNEPKSKTATTAKKKSTHMTQRQEIEKSLQTGTVPSRYRSQVPKEYQKYIPFAR